MSPPANCKFLYLFRVVDGQRTRVRFTVDAAMTILEEKVMNDPPIPVVNAQFGPHIQAMQAKGVEFRMNGHGQLIVQNMPESEKVLYKFFSKYTPCWFAGCEELRAQYDKEVEAAGGENCPACRNGEIIRRYLPKVEELLKRHYATASENQHTGTEGRVS